MRHADGLWLRGLGGKVVPRWWQGKGKGCSSYCV
jgi:hypothetical protein